MLVVVTCGPSYEPIDEVRRLTNFSTGELGLMLAQRMVSAGCEVICFKGVGATSQLRVEGAQMISFGTNDHLRTALGALEKRDRIAAVFHAAALADYRVKSIQTSDGSVVAGRKISTREGPLTLTLEPAAKLIVELRPLFPQARIVGWKYELVGTESEALIAAQRQIVVSDTDACVVNGTAYGRGFGFFQRGRELVHCADKAAICAHLADWVQIGG